MYLFIIVMVVVSAARSIRKALPELRESFNQMSKTEFRSVLAEGKGRWAEVIFQCSYAGRVYGGDLYKFKRELAATSERSFFKDLKKCSKEEVAELFSAIEL